MLVEQTWWLGETAGELVSALSSDSFDPCNWMDFDFPMPKPLTDATLGGGRGPSSMTSPLLVKLVGQDWLGDPDGVRESWVCFP